ncbi:hypothetical protein X777_01374 [Ooceraea biroi]|uniref:Uncharacterized protein n=1 Tax=Ooceraea biroi TaxID=2015173 RepID=A0A026WQU5_OOCBI|nr:hypothetical protein X777_01374 [Ooceraea biroi]
MFQIFCIDSNKIFFEDKNYVVLFKPLEENALSMRGPESLRVDLHAQRTKCVPDWRIKDRRGVALVRVNRDGSAL